jgi:flagellar hook assembly protein FlgD
MESAGSMELAIYNIKGQKVLGKTFEHSEKGNYKFLWDGCDEKGNVCSSGIYTVIMRCGERNYIRKMTILQ